LHRSVWGYLVNTNSTAIFAELDRDAATLVALWLAIYGGDPPPEPVEVSPATALATTGLVAQLRSEFGPSAAPLSDEKLAARLRRLGLELQLSDRTRTEVTADLYEIVCVKGPDGAPGCCVLTPNFPPHFTKATLPSARRQVWPGAGRRERPLICSSPDGTGRTAL